MNMKKIIIILSAAIAALPVSADEYADIKARLSKEPALTSRVVFNAVGPESWTT